MVPLDSIIRLHCQRLIKFMRVCNIFCEKSSFFRSELSLNFHSNCMYIRAGAVACFERWKKAMIVSEVNIQLIKPCNGLVGFASVVVVLFKPCVLSQRRSNWVKWQNVELR